MSCQYCYRCYVKYREYIVLAVSVGLVIFFGIKIASLYVEEPFSGSHRIPSRFEDFSAVAEKEYWTARYEEIGSIAMVAELTNDFHPVQDYRIQHTALHVLGELLFEHEGLSGIVLCDDMSNYGCYHGFMGTAITETGHADVIFQEIANECAQLSDQRQQGSCFHGVGHGILGDLGYEFDSLVEGLTICGSAHTTFFSSSCDAGLFMEYNTRFLLHAPDIFATNPRPLEENPYEPCPSVDVASRRTCYFWLPDWWKTVTNGDYAQIGVWCAAVADPLQKLSCFSGVGKAVAWFSPRDIARTIGLCGRMPHERGRSLCLLEAAATTYQRTEDRELSRSVCDALTEDREVCLQRIERSRSTQ